MLVVVPVSLHDRGLIELFCDVVNFFGPYKKSHQLLVVSRPADNIYAEKVFSKISKNFKHYTLHNFAENGPSGWPAGPNFYWFNTIKYLQGIKNKSPWLWMELDMTPIETTWLDTLEKEYFDSSTDFLGYLQTIDIGMHLVGAGIYPGDFYSRYDSWKTVVDQPKAFDVACQEEITENATHSKYIDHKFRTICYKCTANGLQGIVKDFALFKYPEFSNPVKESAVLVHGCVDSSLAALILNRSSRAFEAAHDELFKILHPETSSQVLRLQ